MFGRPGGGGGVPGWAPARRHVAAIQGQLAAAGIIAGGQQPAAFPPPPPPADEPAGLPPGGLIGIPCSPLLFDSGASGASLSRAGVQNPYDKFVINQQPEPYSLIAPSEDVLMWTSRMGQELTVVNTRLQIITKHHQLKTSPQSVGIVLSSKCVMFTHDYGFMIVISPVDKSFRLIHDSELRISLNGTPLGPSFGPVRANRGRVLAGRATYVLDDKDTIVHLLADPPVALFFRISQIQELVRNRVTTITPLDMKDLTGLPSQLIGRTDPLESAIMMLDRRILLGAPILNTTHLEWAWFDTDKGVCKNERVFDGPDGAPQLHPSYLLKIRLNPLNPKEVLVHIINPHADQQPGGQGRRHGKGELWVMGMSTKKSAFQWKRRERPPSPDDPHYRQLMQTPLDWTCTPEGILYVRWCDFEGIGPGDEYLCDFRHCRSFTLTRVESTVSTLSSMAARVLQGFEQLSFPLPRAQQPQPLQQVQLQPLMSRADRRRASVTGVSTGADFMRHVAAQFIDNTSHVYYDGEQVYDDTEELIEQQRRAISQMHKRTPFRSIFGTLFSQATLQENPVETEAAAAVRGPPSKRRSLKEKRASKGDKESGGSGDKQEEEEEEDGEGVDEEEEPGPSDRPERRRRPSDRGDAAGDGRGAGRAVEGGAAPAAVAAAVRAAAAAGGRVGVRVQMVDAQRWVGDRILGVDNVLELARADEREGRVMGVHRGIHLPPLVLPHDDDDDDFFMMQPRPQQLAAAAAAAADEEQPGMLAEGNEAPEL